MKGLEEELKKKSEVLKRSQTAGRKLKERLMKAIEQVMFYKDNYERVQARVCSALGEFAEQP